MVGTGELFDIITRELASLPDISDISSRQAFLEEAGCGSLAPEVDLTGAATAFFRRLLAHVGQQHEMAVPEFLERVAGSQSIGLDRRQVFLDLRDAVLAVDAASRRALFSPGDLLSQLPSEFQSGTRRGIAELGSKYIPDLYFRRDEIEDRFDEFLRSNATCFLVVSKPGRGKTNLLCNIAHRLHSQRNILFLTARAPLSGPYGLLEVVSSWLGYRADWPACFADMKRLAQPCLILLDAINESATPPELLKEALHYLLREAERTKVKVVITCRTDFWQFYRAQFWSNYIWASAGGGTEWTRSFARGQDLPLFTPEQLEEIATAYFRAFQVDGRLAGEAADRCRHPLMLRIFCEAYAGRSVGIVTELRLYRLLKEFWAGKIEHVAEMWNLRQSDAVARLVLAVAGLMRQRQSTSVPRDEVAKALAANPTELDSSSSLYSRVLDEEIILEENVDEDAGIRNVIFVYDRFSEYVIALSIYAGQQWHSKTAQEILLDVGELMRQERNFGTLRGALEFLVQRLEDRRHAEEIQFAVLDKMIKSDWKWISIGTGLTFQLDPELSGPAFWDFVWKLVGSDVGFIRRIVAEQVGLQVSRSPERVIAVLNRLRQDPVESVRNAAIQAMLGLPVDATVRVIEMLAASKDDQYPAAQLLLWPRDGTSAALRRKLHWLVGAGNRIMPGQAVMRVLTASTPSLMGDLFGQEELTLAMFDLRNELNKNHPGSAELASATEWFERIRRLRDESRAILENDLFILERTFALVDEILSLATSYGTKEGGPLTSLLDLIPDMQMRSRFILEFLEIGEVPDRDLYPNDCLRLAAEKARRELLPHPEANIGLMRPWDFIGRLLKDEDIGRLRQLIRSVCEHARRAAPTSAHYTLGLNTALSFGGLGLDEGALRKFQAEVLDEYEVIASPVELRGLTTIGRLVLWIDDRQRQRQRQESQLLRLREDIKALDPQKLRDRLATYQHPLTTAEQQGELSNELLVLARVYQDRQALLAEMIAPLIIWHDSHDSEVLAEVLDRIHKLDASAFWLLAQALLTQSDQRVIDLASGAIERAEHTERQDPAGAEILAGIAELIEEIAGVPAADVGIDAAIVDDLDLDSLSVVELAVAAQDKFGVAIPDDDLKDLVTVRHIVEYLRRNQSL
jgi:acyl carrier protein